MIDIHNDIIKFLKHGTDEISKLIENDIEISFKKMKIPDGYIYFITKSTITFFMGKLSNMEVYPIGFVLQTKDEYYYYNFKENYSDKKEIIKEFVEQNLI